MEINLATGRVVRSGRLVFFIGLLRRRHHRLVTPFQASCFRPCKGLSFGHTNGQPESAKASVLRGAVSFIAWAVL